MPLLAGTSNLYRAAHSHADAAYLEFDQHSFTVAVFVEKGGAARFQPD
jgi:hypothetical protein